VILDIAMQAMVPIAIADLARWPESTRTRRIAQWTRPGIVDVIASQGDLILYGPGPKATRQDRGDTAEATADLARALAAMAYQPGGITVFGILWCATHAAWGRRSTGQVCADCHDGDRPQPVHPPRQRRARPVATVTPGDVL
jgi:hypothetical protein